MTQIGLAGGINPFAYVSNNPLKGRDPFGLYEEDVHFDLTEYLATQNGCFSAIDARYIGFSNHHTDLNPDTLPAFGDTPEQRSRNRNFHALTPGDHALYERALWAQTRSGNRVQRLSALGTYLHFVQDEFSHEGYTNSIYGHVFGTHVTDKTNWDVGKTLAMARATFQQINRFSRENCGCEGTLSQASMAKVTQFAEAPGGNSLTQFTHSIESNNPNYLRNKRKMLGLPPR